MPTLVRNIVTPELRLEGGIEQCHSYASKYSHNVPKKWGRGIERCYFIAPEYGYDAPKKGLPLVINVDYIRSQLGTMPSLRKVARLALLDTTSPDITNIDQAKNVVNSINKSPIKSVGDMYTEMTDTNRTTNHVIPLKTDKGVIEVVVNGAWGVSWRLSEDHELANTYPSLMVCQPEDTSFGNDKMYSKYYLSPEVLEAVTKEHVDPQILAGRIQTYLENLLGTYKIEQEITSTSRGTDYDGEEQSQTFGLCTNPHNNTIPYFGISFQLGNKEGIKWIDAFGFSNSQEKLHNLDKLAQEGRDIGDFIRSFYHPH